jgi:hypothetical protein
MVEKIGRKREKKFRWRHPAYTELRVWTRMERIFAFRSSTIVANV